MLVNSLAIYFILQHVSKNRPQQTDAASLLITLIVVATVTDLYPSAKQSAIHKTLAKATLNTTTVKNVSLQHLLSAQMVA